jgi:hypothetical protein
MCCKKFSATWLAFRSIAAAYKTAPPWWYTSYYCSVPSPPLISVFTSNACLYQSKNVAILWLALQHLLQVSTSNFSPGYLMSWKVLNFMIFFLVLFSKYWSSNLLSNNNERFLLYPSWFTNNHRCIRKFIANTHEEHCWINELIFQSINMPVHKTETFV